MIKLKQPALALHAWDMKGPTYKMWASWVLPKRARPRTVIDWILYARSRTPELRLPNVLIRCHGESAELDIGGEDYSWTVDDTINIHNVSLFNQLRGKDIGTIWLHTCWVAWPPHGPIFCEQMAREAGCNVVAGSYLQFSNHGGAYASVFGGLDDFEGPTFCWDASGKMYEVGKDGAGVPTVG